MNQQSDRTKHSLIKRPTEQVSLPSGLPQGFARSVTYDEVRRINDEAHLRKAVMTNQEQPVHLNNHHTDTLTAIFAHPTSHNVRWHDAVSLLEAVGTVEENHSGKFKIHVGDQMEFFDRPKGHDCGEQQIVDVRKMLKEAGFEPTKPGHED